MKQVWIAMLYVNDTSDAMKPAHVHLDSKSADIEVDTSPFGGMVEVSYLVTD